MKTKQSMPKQTIPFSSPELWEYLSKHSFLSSRHKLLYVSTPKVACTSLKWWFASLEGHSREIRQYTDSLETDIDLIIHDVFSKVAPDVTGLPQEKLTEAVSSDAYFRFAVVRNPYERIFSAWQSKILLREPLQSEPYWEQDFFWVPVKNIRGISLAFEAFLEHLAVHEYPHYWDVHWTPQVTLLKPDLLSYTKIAQIEAPKDLLSMLSKHLGIGFVNPFANYTKNKSLIPYSPDFITKRSAELIQMQYEEDFEKFGYGKSLSESTGEPLKNDSVFQAIHLIRNRNKRISQIRSSLSSDIAALSETVQKKEQALQKISTQAQGQEVEMRKLNIKLKNKKESILKFNTQIVKLEHTVQENDRTNQELSNEVSEGKEWIHSLNEQLSKREKINQELSNEVREGKEWIHSLNEQLSEIKNSRGWKLIWLLWQVRLFFVPKASQQEFIIRKIWNRLTGETSLQKVSQTKKHIFLSAKTYRFFQKLYWKLPISLMQKHYFAKKILTTLQLKEKTDIDRYINPFDTSLKKKRVITDNFSKTHAGKQILIIEHRLPTPDKNSSSLRLYSILKLIVKLGWGVTFVSNSLALDYKWILSDIKKELPAYEKLLDDLGVTYLYGKEEAIQYLKAKGGNYSFALLSYPEIMHEYSPIVRAFMPNAHLIYDTVDLHGIRFAREAITKNNDVTLSEKARLYEKMECANIEIADTVIAITDVEKSEILKRNSKAIVKIIPNIHSLSLSSSSFEQRKGLLFIGHYLHTPNEDAVIYFIEDIFPRVQEKLGDIPFYILGSSITKKIKQYESKLIQPIGYAKDLQPWFDKSRVFVAPLRYGAGMKGKIGQSLGFGLPIVTTSIGAEGMMLENKKHILIADTPSIFSENIIRLYEDAKLWGFLSKNGQDHVSQHFSATAVQNSIKKLFDAEKSDGIS